MQVLQPEDSIVTSVVTADFDCMQFPSRAKAFSFPFSTVAIFWLLDWLWRFAQIHRNKSMDYTSEVWKSEY